MTARKIDFPDTEAPDFDANEPFVASNGNTYVYNGWGWELQCAGENGDWVTHEELEKDQERQDEEWRLDQERQDKEIEDLKKALAGCPEVTSTAKEYQDTSGDPQIAIKYQASGNQGGPGNAYTDVTIYDFEDRPDHEKDWISINGTKYEVYSTFNWEELNTTQYSIDTKHGDLESIYVGQEVTIHNCDEEETTGNANISLLRVSQGNKAVWLGNKQDPPEADPDGKVGWYYRNPGVDSRKAHWTLWSQETNAHKHITLGDLKSLSLLIQGTSELPYIQVYTKRQNDGQDAGTTYRSRITYQPPANSGGLQSEVFVTTNLETELYANVNRLEFEHEEWNDKGPLGDDEQISKIIVSTNSTSPEGTYEFLLQAMVIETAIGTFEMQVEITGATGDVPEQMVFYGAAPPDDAPKGAIFTDEDTLKIYVHQGDSVWIEHTTCVGGGGGGDSTDSPWVRIDDWRVVREYNAFASSSPDGFCSKILLWDVPCNESKPHTLTQEWEWDEIGDDSWVAYDPEADANAYAENYQRDWYWRYRYAPEDYDGNGMDGNHPFPCAKVRCRVKNEWDSGEFEYSDWVEFWIGRAAAPAYNHPHQPPTIC